jgi:hypothetical protein
VLTADLAPYAEGARLDTALAESAKAYLGLPVSA